MEEKIEFIYLVQHGKSFSEEQNPKKPLLDVGVEETGRVADFLKYKNIIFYALLLFGVFLVKSCLAVVELML